MTHFTPLLMTAADRHSLLAELAAAGLQVAGTPAVASSKSFLAPAAAPAPAAKPVAAAWPDTLRSLLSTVRTKLEAI